ncbi:uncharacterized protein E5676_scaffold227G00620 [Cucumis melo var. makuwa]|uniref:Uncharacterized protein n=1 Tax=Cucumis melo var. makuwa TaxID=1194695 RepID=A0A5D3CJ40_CUCMM|nr:uncharacterized protein E5676_scaffold227G00620 [Cucumis melo var. makuwa]
MMTARLKSSNRKATWEVNFSKKQSYSKKTDEQLATSIADKHKDVDTQDAAKRKENTIALAEEEGTCLSEDDKEEEEAEFIEPDDRC